MSIRKRDVHFSDWTKVRHALVCNNVQGITETSSFDEVRAFLINSESGSNPFYYYVCYIKETNEIYTHGAFYNCTGYNDSDIRDLIQNVEDSFVEQITALQNEVEENEKVTTMALYDLNDRKANKDDLQNINLDKYVDWDSLYNETNSLYSSLQSSINSNYTTLNNNKADKSDLEALSAEVEENEEVTAAALTELHENKADKSEIPDVSTLATKADLAPLEACCDTKLSCEDLGTINGQSICGNDVTITEPDHYASGAATVDGSGFVTSVTTNEAGHVTKVSARAITDNDITSISASKITGTINIENLPTGALERMFVVEDETAAMSATVEEGDVVQVTGNGNKMYFCVRSGATTFSDKFMEFTAGTATSVAWSGVTGKPEGIDGWGDRISTVEADMDNYLPLSGGTITGDFYIQKPSNATIIFQPNNAAKSFWFGVNTSEEWFCTNGGYTETYKLIHSGNYRSYPVKNPKALSWSGFSSGSYDGSTAQNIALPTKLSQFTDDIVAGKYLPLTGGTVNGQITSEAVENFVAKGTDYSIYFGIGSGHVNRGIYDVTNNHWWIYRSNSTDTYIPNGNVAIGGTTASEKLHVYGNVISTGAFNSYSANSHFHVKGKEIVGSYETNYFLCDSAPADGITTWLSGRKVVLATGSTKTRAVTIDDSQNMGVGTSSPSSKLHVNGNIRIDGDSNPLLTLKRGSDSARYVQAVSTGLRVGVGGTTNLLIQDDGKCKAVDFQTTSDNRLKDFVSDIDLDFEALKLIPKKYYYWKDKSMGEELQIGTSAQELAKIYPTCVSYDEVSDRYSVNYQKLSIVALAAIDKLHERVSELESKLND